MCSVVQDVGYVDGFTWLTKQLGWRERLRAWWHCAASCVVINTLSKGDENPSSDPMEWAEFMVRPLKRLVLYCGGVKEKTE